MDNAQLHAKYNRIIAASVLGFSFIVFMMSVAPTVSFWDCGEYIGACHSLAIPHPPGNPFYVILGRIFSMLFFFFRQVAFRINLISPVSAALIAMVMYLIVVRTTVAWLGIPDTSWKRLTVYVGGVAGSLFAVFGTTFWSSAVESEVIVPSMLCLVLSAWLVLVWAQSKSPDRDRFLILISYITFLGIGIHLMSMMAMAPIFLYVVVSDRSKLTDWRLWLTGVIMSLAMFSVSSFLWLGPIIVLFNLVMMLMGGPQKQRWSLCFWISLFALLGYSTHAYIPIRSALQPMIDENHPATWDALVQFLERKQYGSENMFLRAFWRRGTFENQFGIDGHMGYGGFHLTQFFRFSSLDTERSLFADGAAFGWLKLVVYLLPTAFMLYGWYGLYRKNRNLAVMLVLLVAGMTLFMTWYMNFADGTRPERRDYLMWMQSGKRGPMPVVHREVRVRDYFWTAGFMFYGMWIGVAATVLLHYLFTNKNQLLRGYAGPIVTVLLAVSPALPLTQNFGLNNRKGDWVPYDYAYNLLMSCDKDGILFTNGDNDTFPLWFLQEAEGIRRDVRIVNLSLLNTKWYIDQLKAIEPRVPISFTAEEIATLNHEINPFTKDTPFKLRGIGLDIVIPGREKLNALRVQDKMVLNIVDSNRWTKPVYFAVTVSDDNRMGLDPYLVMEGLVYRIMPQVVAPEDRVDIDKTVFFLDKVFRFRSLGDGKAALNETTQKLLSNYAAGYIQVAYSLGESLERMKNELTVLESKKDSVEQAGGGAILAQKRNEYVTTLDLVITKLDQCVALMPWDWRPRTLRHRFLMVHDRTADAEKRMQEAMVIDPDNLDYMKMLAQALDQAGKKAEANELLKKIVGLDKDPWYAYLTLAKNYEDAGNFDSALAMMKQFQAMHPGDRRASQMITRYEAMKRDEGAMDTSMKPAGAVEEKPKG